MGSGVSTSQDGGSKLQFGTVEEFQSQLEEHCNHSPEQLDEMARMLKVAQKVVGRKLRERSAVAIKEMYPPKEDRLEELWTLCDYNCNGFTSLAELDKMIVENFPEYDNKPAIIRAYHATDRNKNGFITKGEFRNFFGFLSYFTELWEKFEEVDDNNDRRIDFEEMKRHIKIFGRDLSDKEAAILFSTIDRNGGGKILFYEFAAHMAYLDKKDFGVDKLPFE